MEASFRSDAEKLNWALRKGIMHLEDRGLSRPAIGKGIGYASRDMVDKVMSEPTVLFGPVQLLRFSRICSEQGFDDLSDMFSADGKYATPYSHEINGEVADEVCAIVQGAGIGSLAFQTGDIFGARMHSERLARAAMGFRSEVYHRFDMIENLEPCAPLFEPASL